MGTTRSNYDMDWLPGLGKISHDASGPGSAPDARFRNHLKIQAVNSENNEVEFSIVCDDCNKHFWSRSNADCHAAITGHCLYKPTKPFDPKSRAVDSVYAPEIKTPPTLATEVTASLNTEILDERYSEHYGDAEDVPYVAYDT